NTEPKMSRDVCCVRVRCGLRELYISLFEGTRFCKLVRRSGNGLDWQPDMPKHQKQKPGSHERAIPCIGHNLQADVMSRESELRIGGVKGLMASERRRSIAA